MDSQPDTTKARKTLMTRVVWFLVGAIVNYLLISTPFKFLEKHYPGMGVGAISACSIGVSTVFFFMWNYFIGFRTDARKRDAFVRYLTAALILWAMSSSLLTLLNYFHVFPTVNFLGHQLILNVVATQACFGPLKFIVYHKWAFPVAKSGPPNPPASVSIATTVGE